MPFEVPDNWVWTIVGEVGEVITGSTPSKDIAEYYGGDIPFYKPTDLDLGINTNSASDTLTIEGYNLSRKLPVGSILVTCIGATIGKTGLISTEGACNQQINAIIPSSLITSTFLYYSCISEYFQKEIRNHASATTLPILNKNNFTKLLIPLPPLSEQQRIVKEIEWWFALIGQIEQDKVDLQTIIKQTKSKILDLAIHGKLVPQDPNDEPAIELLTRINPDFTPCDNGHSEKLPKNWTWAKGINIFLPMKSTKPKDEEFQYIDIDSIDNKRQIINGIKTLKTSKAPSRASRYTQKNDVIFSMVRPYLRNIAKVINDNCIASTGFYVCSPTPKLLNSDYCYYLMISEYVVNGLNQFMKGDNSPSISKGHIDEWLFPLPPFAEQQRIVQKIEALFSVLDNIQNALEV